jgi:hypothetical protein
MRRKWLAAWTEVQHRTLARLLLHHLRHQYRPRRVGLHRHPPVRHPRVLRRRTQACTEVIDMRYASAILVCLALLTFEVRAEGNCPPGYFPIGGLEVQGCAPMDSGSSGSPPNPGPQWAKRWGAIATDGPLGRLGGAEGLPNKRRAQKAAIATCQQNGGKKCKVLHAYYNQCGVLAWGNDLAQTYSAGTVEKATELALLECSKQTGNCKVFYSGCSYPERVR